MKRLLLIAACLIGSSATADPEFAICESKAKSKSDKVSQSAAMMTCLTQQSKRQLAEARAKFGVQPTAPFNNWTLGIRPDPITDATIVQMFTDSPEGSSCGGGPTRVTLEIRCENNTTTLTIGAAACFMVSKIGNYGRVTYRVDDKPAKSIQMTESTDNEVLGLWTGNKSIPVIKQFFNGKKLLVRMTPYKHSPVDVAFDITGVETVIRPLRETCHW